MTTPHPAPSTHITGFAKAALIGGLLAAAVVKQGFSVEYALRVAEPVVVRCSAAMTARVAAHAAEVQRLAARRRMAAR